MFDQARIPIISTKIGYRTLIVAVGPLFAEFDKWFIGEEKQNYANRNLLTAHNSNW
jgi:hypothetical protein